MPYGTYPSGLTSKHTDLPICPRFTLRKAIPSAFPHTFLRHSISQSVHSGTGILTCFPFAFAALLMLRSRLPQGGQTFPWKPWTSGRRDSRPPSRYSFLHSHFWYLQHPFQDTFYGLQNALLPNVLPRFRGFGSCLSPVISSAQILSTSELLRTLSRYGCF